MMQLEKKHQLAILVVIGIIIFGAGFKYAQYKSAMRMPEELVLEKQAGQTADRPAEIVVHVTGAVSNPGVYRFTDGARVIDAVEKAKALPEANLDAINLAALLADSQPVVIPYKPAEAPEHVDFNGTPVPAGTPVSTGENYAAGAVPVNAGPGKVNINSAGIAGLDSLPGIGETLAGRIVQYRQSNGPFRTIEDLKNVSGIGERKFEDLKDMITVY